MEPGLPVLVPFSGADHDWAAVELAARLALARGAALTLAGASRGASGRDASRLLASASLALQRGLGVHVEPVIIEPTSEALAAQARRAGIVVVGLTDRWRTEGLGRARTALATAGATTMLVRGGRVPPALERRAGRTRFTWTVGGG
jgi:methylmalonyl-CoA mutase cobalamin-binding subunit